MFFNFLLQFSIVCEKTLHDFVFSCQLLPQLPDNGLCLTEHDLLDDMMVGGVVEEEIVDDRPACCHTVREWTAWLTSAQVQASQKLKPKMHVDQVRDELLVGGKSRMGAEMAVEGDSLHAEQMPRQPESLAVSRFHPDLVWSQLVG